MYQISNLNSRQSSRNSAVVLEVNSSTFLYQGLHNHLVSSKVSGFAMVSPPKTDCRQSEFTPDISYLSSKQWWFHSQFQGFLETTFLAWCTKRHQVYIYKHIRCEYTSCLVWSLSIVALLWIQSPQMMKHQNLEPKTKITRIQATSSSSKYSCYYVY